MCHKIGGWKVALWLTKPGLIFLFPCQLLSSFHWRAIIKSQGDFVEFLVNHSLVSLLNLPAYCFLFPAFFQLWCQFPRSNKFKSLCVIEQKCPLELKGELLPPEKESRTLVTFRYILTQCNGYRRYFRLFSSGSISLFFSLQICKLWCLYFLYIYEIC